MLDRQRLEAEAFAASPLAQLVIDADGLIHTANDAAAVLVERPVAELEGSRLADLTESSQRLELAALLDAARGGGSPRRREICFVRPDGTVRIGGFSLARMSGGLLVAVIRDVTEERSLRDSLIDAERPVKIRLDPETAERMADLVLVHRHGRVIHANDVAVRLLGHEHGADVIGRLVMDIVHPEDRGQVSQPGGLRLLRRSGDYVEIEMMSVAVLFHGEPAVLAVGRDLTERKRLEAQLALGERLVAIGTLAAGIAHEINNPLAYVITNLELMSEELADGSCQLGRQLRECRDGAERIRKIVRGLKGLSHGDTEQRTPLDVRTVLEQAARLTMNEIRHRARLCKELGPVPMVMADEARLTQVFVNLLLNAAQAIPEGSVDQHQIAIATSTDPSGRAVIAIRDTGCGIAPEDVARIFDPFFTLKPPGVGTGLGLPISHGIVVALGGTITVESTPGTSSTFRVTLPAAESGAVASVTGAPVVVAETRSRVLVIDDEPILLASVQRALENDHDVVTVESGRQAIALLASGARFDCILCDLMMPDRTGMDLFAELRDSDGEQAERIVFVTGGAFSRGARAFLERVNNPRLEKPFDLETLRTLVRQVSSSPPASNRSTRTTTRG